MTDISTNKVGFKNLTYTLTALPLVPYIKLEGSVRKAYSGNVRSRRSPVWERMPKASSTKRR